jgi:hypothetical protein
MVKLRKTSKTRQSCLKNFWVITSNVSKSCVKPQKDHNVVYERMNGLEFWNEINKSYMS